MGCVERYHRGVFGISRVFNVFILYSIIILGKRVMLCMIEDTI